MVLSEFFSAYALDMRMLYIGAAVMWNIIAALSGIGEFDLNIGFVTKFLFLQKQAEILSYTAKESYTDFALPRKIAV